MTFPTSSDDLRGLAAIRAELDRLEKQDAELQSALDDVEHDTRRCNDALERAGWRSGEAEARTAMLAESREAIVDDREKNRVRRAQLTGRLALVRIRLNDDEHDD
jgi:chromosome segregation ATPase